jgi:catechol 2,3-dioxygenase-like lactoylglutathione lyase family enzyme
LADTLQFLDLFGFKPLIENMYEGLGRQYIWSRGKQDDADYIEKDTFTSFSSVERPKTDMPRIGDTIFRMSHPDPMGIYRTLKAKRLVDPMVSAEYEAAFLAGEADRIIYRGPDGQRYELCATLETTAENHTVYVCTDPAELEATLADFTAEFGLRPAGAEDFYGYATAHLLKREDPGITIALLIAAEGTAMEPRWTDDIFKEAGYSHYRMGSPDMAHTEAATRQAFPKGGDVAFVYFRESYLELVQVEDVAVAAAE